MLEALVARALDDEILGGIPFMVKNDVWLRQGSRNDDLPVGQSGRKLTMPS